MTKSVIMALLTGGLYFAVCGSAVADDKAVDTKKLKNPIPYNKKSISQGRSIFARYCTGCHGNDGKATVDVIADATDLTSPKLWKNGTTEGEIFKSIRDGQGASMPAFKTQLKQEDDIWNLVNFVRSLWPESMRPPLRPDPPPSEKDKSN